MAEGRDYTIEIDDLKPDGHKGYEMVEEAIEALMRTILTLKLPDGKTRRVQFLGGNDLDDPDRPAGVLTYSFDKRLIEVLKDSTIWGKIALPVLMAFTSKYAVSLYENLAQFANLTKKTFQDYTLDEFRDLLGVPPGRYKTFGELNKHVIKPAVTEVNALASFGVVRAADQAGQEGGADPCRLVDQGRGGAARRLRRAAALQGRPPRPHCRHGRACQRAHAFDLPPDAGRAARARTGRFPRKPHSWPAGQGSCVSHTMAARPGPGPASPETSYKRPGNLILCPEFSHSKGLFCPGNLTGVPNSLHNYGPKRLIQQGNSRLNFRISEIKE